MKWYTDFKFDPISHPAGYQDKILMTGSCFAEHIGNYLRNYKFNVQVNPHGILFNPVSIVRSLDVCLGNERYTKSDLFFDHGLWHSWDHHEYFSHPDADKCIEVMNISVEKGFEQLTSADWLIITLGSAGVYNLKSGSRVVGNCHKRPSGEFEFSFMKPDDIISVLDGFIHRLFIHNKKIKIIFTVSPVRYLSYGLIKNNISKSALLYAVHHLVNKFDRIFYFPSYEIVIDELRDYRFFEEDLVHPNHQAIQYVCDRFITYFLSEEAQQIYSKIRPVIRAVQHKALHPESESLKDFAKAQYEKIELLMKSYPFLNFEQEKQHFESFL